MSFVYMETTEEMNKKMEEKGLTYLSNESINDAFNVVVDLERDYWFAYRGGDGHEIPIEYCLYMDGEIINIVVKEESQGDRYQKNYRFLWVIEKMKVSATWAGDVEKLKKVIEEAAICKIKHGSIQDEWILSLVIENNAEIEIDTER